MLKVFICHSDKKYLDPHQKGVTCSLLADGLIYFYWHVETGFWDIWLTNNQTNGTKDRNLLLEVNLVFHTEVFF